ncbi:MAG: EAL domain-containing protein [Solirubrobacteraceae bacterium]|jgi:diguanylate cyclase (GGDEF)-like protein/PAS domain S-box-containing protein
MDIGPSAPSYEQLRARMQVAEETLDAIRRGEVDGLLVRTDQGERLFTLQGADAFYRMLLEEMPLGVAGLDPHGTILFANPHLGRMLRLPVQRLIGKQIAEFLPSDRQTAARAALLRSAGGELPELAELRNAEGETFPVAVQLRGLPGDGEASSCLIVGDLTDMQRELADSYLRYEQMVETATEGILETDAHEIITFVNQTMADLLGRQPAEMIGRPVLELYAEASIPEARRSIERHRLGVSNQSEYLLVAKDGSGVWVLMSSNPRRDLDGAYAGALAMVTDVSERKRMEDRLRYLADRDSLTGLSNRRRLIERLEQSLADAARYDRHGAVLMIDLDNFKITNDTYGHATGDVILRSAAEVLSASIRETDLVARLGGDEFAILLQDAGEEAAKTVAAKIHALLHEPRTGPPIPVSIGVTTFRGAQQTTADELLAAADSALYEAKQRGGDQLIAYRKSAAGLSWVHEIRAALDESRLTLYAQPILDLRTSNIVRHEVLVRMLSRDGDLIPPDAFLPSAERFGLIREIDQQVNSAALNHARSTPFTINLSSHSIGQNSILAALRAAIASGLDPANVIYEVTETAAMRNIASAKLFAEELNSLGCELALDDFGTGFGSFTYLKHIPARYLKLDIEFVRSLVTNQTDQALIKGIVTVAHSLGKLTIAEGVENAATLELLRSYGIEYAQGFHIGRPRPITLSGASMTPPQHIAGSESQQLG